MIFFTLHLGGLGAFIRQTKQTTMISKIKAILFVLTHSGQFLFIPNEWKGVIIDFSTRRAKPHELTVDEFDEIMSCDWEDVKEDGI